MRQTTLEPKRAFPSPCVIFGRFCHKEPASRNTPYIQRYKGGSAVILQQNLVAEFLWGLSVATTNGNRRVADNGSTGQDEEETNCCRRWWSIPSRPAMGCIDFRRPSSIKPCRYRPAVARWSRRVSGAKTSVT